MKSVPKVESGHRAIELELEPATPGRDDMNPALSKALEDDDDTEHRGHSGRMPMKNRKRMRTWH